jgi:hypothetical protein
MSKQWNTPPEMQIESDKEYTAHMETEKGTIVLALFDKAYNGQYPSSLSREGFRRDHLPSCGAISWFRQ